ncbi:cytochrome P450 [Streptomyces sp. 1-11]|uniref:cytochrome P450 n=1 Tax=Streptomyces sp. 1-11 TaxID=2590549 RepID=UPI00116C3EC9|nr:cytochrome P450 [Streptomyces sp. 1-11]GEK04379.1 hypothetical protein TNCT1_66550 [Streptomyces sp. 1-11]
MARQPDGTYVVSTYREIVALLHDPRVSSDPRKCPVPAGAQAAGAEPAAEPIREALTEPNIITCDPPEHDRDRRTMMPHFAGPPQAPHLDRYAREPGPGMLSVLVNEDGAEGRMSKGVLVSNALLLIFAGHETTVNLIAHSVLTLLRHPDALEKLRRRPELIVPGVEELLRFESSVQFWHTRSAVEDIDIAGTTIPKGAPIFLAYGSANRDPQRFTDPDTLDLERPDNQHLGFSQGIHFCFGAPLARLEVQVAVGEFVRRVQNPRLVQDPPPYRHNQIFRGPRHVLVDIDGIRD